MLFPTALFLPTTFPKIVNNSIFLSNFHQKRSKLTKHFVFFPLKRAKISAGFIKSFETLAKIMHFTFMNNCFKFSRFFGVNGAPPDPLTRPTLVKCPPNRNPGGTADFSRLFSIAFLNGDFSFKYFFKISGNLIEIFCYISIYKIKATFQ